MNLNLDYWFNNINKITMVYEQIMIFKRKPHKALNALTGIPNIIGILHLISTEITCFQYNVFIDQQTADFVGNYFQYMATEIQKIKYILIYITTPEN